MPLDVVDVLDARALLWTTARVLSNDLLHNRNDLESVIRFILTFQKLFSVAFFNNSALEGCDWVLVWVFLSASDSRPLAF